MASRTIALNVTANTQKYVAELRKLGTHTEKQIGAAARKASATFQKAELENIKNARKAAREIQKAQEQSAHATAQAWDAVGTALVAAFSAATVRAVADMVDQVQSARTEIAALSYESGVATDTLSGLRTAAARNGEELSRFDSMLRDLPKRLAETAAGTGEALRGFNGLGIKVTDANGELRQTDEVLRETIEKLQAIEDPTRRAALATQAFGGEGAVLMRTLGGTELGDFIAYADQFGADVGPEAIASAERWAAATADLSMQLDRISAELVDSIDLTRQLEGFTTGLVTVYETGWRTLEKYIDRMSDFGSIAAVIATGGASAWVEFGMAMDDATTEAAALLDERAALQAQLQGDTETTNAAGVATLQLSEEQTKAAESARQWAAEQQKLARELDRMLSIQGQIQGIADRAQEDIRGQVAQTNIAYQDQITRVYQLADAAEALAKSEMERESIREDALTTIAALESRRDRELAQIKEANEAAKQGAIDAASLAAAKAQASEATQSQAMTEKTLQSAMQQTAQITGQLAGAFKEGSKEAAIAAKAAGIVQATASTFVAANQALTVPIIGPGLAAAATAIGLANVAQIASTPIPAFADGGRVPYNAPRAVSNGTDERLITARPDEVILTPSDYERMRNAGGGSTTVNLRLNNRTLQTVIMQSERQTGAVSRAIGRPGLVQHRDKVRR